MTDTFGGSILGKRDGDEQPSEPETAAKRQHIEPTLSDQAVQLPQHVQIESLLQYVLECDVSERKLLREPNHNAPLSSNHSFRKMYDVHWRMTLLMRMVQANKVV